MNEEGDFIGGGDDGADMGEFGGDDGAGDLGDQAAQAAADHEQPPEMEMGFEDAGLDNHGFGNYSPEKAEKNLRSMFMAHNSKRFDAGGGADQKIQLNQFAIRKQVDVKRLKHKLWETMDPILTH